MNAAKKLTFWILGIAVLLLLTAWLLLSSTLFANVRADLAARYLSDKLGHPVQINGNLDIGLGATLQVSVRDIVMPSPSLADVALVEVDAVHFGLKLKDLLGGTITLGDPRATGARITLLAQEDGRSSWFVSEQSVRQDSHDIPTTKNPLPETTNDPAPDLFGLIAGMTVRVTDSHITYQDGRNGLDLDLRLNSLDLSRSDSTSPIVMKAEGDLNNQPVILTGTSQQAGVLTLNAEFDKLMMRVDATSDPQGFGAGYTATITADVEELHQLLAALKMKPHAQGFAQVNAVFRSEQGRQYIDDLKIDIELENGPNLQLRGELGELGNPNDANIDARLLLYAPDMLPPSTQSWRDLRLVGVDMRLIARPGDEPLREMVIATNGFSFVTGGVGTPPIQISDISRTADGLLRLGNAEIRLGPSDAPYVVLRGSIADGLLMHGQDFEADLHFPIGAMFAPELAHKTNVLGVLSGHFKLQGDGANVALVDLEASVEGTDLLRLGVAGQIAGVLDARDVDLDISAEIPSATELLAKLGVTPRAPGTFGLLATVSSQGVQWASDLTLTAGESVIEYTAEFDLNRENPVIGRRIDSDYLRISDIQSIVSTVEQIREFNSVEHSDTANSLTNSKLLPHDYVVQPLVLENQDASELTRTTMFGTAPQKGKRIVQPLVLRRPELMESAPVKGLPPHGNVIQPLLIEKPDREKLGQSGIDRPIGAEGVPGTGAFRDVTLEPLSRAIMGSDFDVGISIDLRRIVGVEDFTSLRSYLEIDSQRARLGPIRFAYGGGRFDMTASMNFMPEANIIRLTGTAGGWDFGKLLSELGFKKRANGILDASFDVTGSNRSLNDFLSTLSGQATLSMRNGSIESELLDLAGLGVIPWLFSTDRKEDTPLTCINLPLVISNGRITTNYATVETDLVQIVVNGDVDLRKNTLSIAAQPRQIGKPLSPSPWPFTASGSITDPRVTLNHSLPRQYRTDGASDMPRKRQLCVADILQLE